MPPTWWSLGYGVFLNFGFAQIIWFGLVRVLPAQASAFSIMAVPLVGIASATADRRRGAAATDWLAALCIAVAHRQRHRATPRGRPRSDNAAAMNRRPRLALIAAVDRRRAIGRDGALLWHETEDQRHFRAVTMGCAGDHGSQDLGLAAAQVPAAAGAAQHRRDAQFAVARRRRRSRLVAGSTALAMASGAAKVFVIGGGELYALAMRRPTNWC